MNLWIDRRGELRLSGRDTRRSSPDGPGCGGHQRWRGWVHLKAEGQVRVGKHLAQDLLPILESLPKAR